MISKNFISRVLVIIYITINLVYARFSPNRVGTTAANFLELGYDPKGIAMGDAYVSIANSLSSIYWNPSGLSFMNKKEAFFSYQPWIVNTNTFFCAAGIPVKNVGTFAISLFGIDYGEMEVTTVELQDGTGETFSPRDLAFTFSYGHLISSWFGFGATIKYINSSIYHCSASAVAADFGVIIQTKFFSPTSDGKYGMKIGMSLSNYGSRMRYRGLDLLRSLDIAPDEAGNYKDVQVEFKTDSWELPLIFRIGFSLNPIVSANQLLTLALDAIHPNNNSESINVGVKYLIRLPGIADFIFRAGYRGLFMEDSVFGPTFGFGILTHVNRGVSLRFDYAFRSIRVLGNSNAIGFSFLIN